MWRAGKQMNKGKSESCAGGHRPAREEEASHSRLYLRSRYMGPWLVVPPAGGHGGHTAESRQVEARVPWAAAVAGQLLG